MKIEKIDPYENEEYYDSTVKFVSSYKNILTYENEDYIIEVMDYKYHFNPEDKIGFLRYCDSFEVKVKGVSDEV